mmetsp:Transcript_11231/g.45484  ORF Transcript_11231/g.45484 Transcript_11231/m.45484 type:complete len:229 (-) Transcript_11231:564-1250(-)
MVCARNMARGDASRRWAVLKSRTRSKAWSMTAIASAPSASVWTQWPGSPYHAAKSMIMTLPVDDATFDPVVPTAMVIPTDHSGDDTNAMPAMSYRVLKSARNTKSAKTELTAQPYGHHHVLGSSLMALRALVVDGADATGLRCRSPAGSNSSKSSSSSSSRGPPPRGASPASSARGLVVAVLRRCVPSSRAAVAPVDEPTFMCRRRRRCDRYASAQSGTPYNATMRPS